MRHDANSSDDSEEDEDMGSLIELYQEASAKPKLGSVILELISAGCVLISSETISYF